MTAGDIETLRELKYVEYVDLYDRINDVYFMREEGKDYVLNEVHQVSL